MLKQRWLGRFLRVFLIIVLPAGSVHAALPPAAEAKLRNAVQLSNARRNDEALKAVDSFLAELRGEDMRGNSSYVEGLAFAAGVCESCGDPKKGLLLANKALESSETLDPANPHVTGLAHVAAANCHRALGSESQAKEEANRAWEVLGRVTYRGTVPNLIPRCHSMVRLASNCNGLGDSMMAEKYYRLAVDDARRLMAIELQGPTFDLGKFAAAARAFSSLGAFYVQSGDHRRAIPLVKQSMAILERSGPRGMGNQSQDREAASISLARAYLGVGEIPLATRYISEALQTATMTSNRQRLFVAKSVRASIHSELGEYDEALKVTAEVQEIQRTMRNDPDYQNPALVNNAGWLSLLKGDFDRAKGLLTRAYQLLSKGGEKDPNLEANILFSLAMVEFLQDNPDRGLMGLKKASSIYEGEIDRMVGFGSDSQKLAYLQKLRAKTDFILGMAFDKYREHEEFSQEAWLTVIRRKGRMTRLLRESARLLQEGDMTRTEKEQLKQARAKLSLLGLSLGIVSREGANEFDQDWMVELEETERAIQRKLASKSGTSATTSQLTFDQLKSSLGEGEAMLEYVVYRPFRLDLPKSEATSIPLRCGVLAMNAEGRMEVIDLGDYREVQQLAIRFRKSLATAGGSGYEGPAKDLYRKLITPVLGVAGKSTQWRIAPDGQLGMIPFGALLDEEGSYLDSRVEVTYLANAGESLTPKEPIRKAGKLTIFAGPDYSLGRVRTAASTEALGFDPRLGKFWEEVSRIGAPLQFQPLPGTVEEAQALKKIMPDAEVIEGKEATEESFAKVGGGGILHLATHGFYLNEELIADNEQRGLKRVKAPKPLGLENVEEDRDQGNWIGRRSLDHPLLNCGLVFSGANQLFDGSDDGVMTGLEVLSLDLRGTDLLVLSACETGVGEVVTGEGVLGLNQAFRVAGASSLVTSLWKVNDEATSALMAAFYSELSEGTPKGEALRKAKAQIREKEAWSHPSFWAAFTLTGDAGSLAK